MHATCADFQGGAVYIEVATFPGNNVQNASVALSTMTVVNNTAGAYVSLLPRLAFVMDRGRSVTECELPPPPTASTVHTLRPNPCVYLS